MKNKKRHRFVFRRECGILTIQGTFHRHKRPDGSIGDHFIPESPYQYKNKTGAKNVLHSH